MGRFAGLAGRRLTAAHVWRTSGGAQLDGQVLAVNDAPTIRFARSPRIAVVTDVGVVSSGVAIAIAFRGRPDTRSLGTATCGLSTGVRQIRLDTGGRIAVVNSVMVDRQKTRYGGAVVPDETIRDRDVALRRAGLARRIAR